jgi:hypothetical protein
MEVHMLRLIENLRTHSKKLMLAAAASAAVAVPTIASATEHDLGAARYDRGDRYERTDRNARVDVRFDLRIGDTDAHIRIPGPGPVYEDRTERVWIEPVYRTVCERVWRPAITREVCDRVWVEPVYEIREVVRVHGWRREVTRERYVMTPGHWEERRSVIVVAEGRWDNIERQELVAPGHWETRTTRVVVHGGPWWRW